MSILVIDLLADLQKEPRIFPRLLMIENHRVHLATASLAAQRL